jgi:hypothetical protein
MSIQMAMHIAFTAQPLFGQVEQKCGIKMENSIESAGQQ